MRHPYLSINLQKDISAKGLYTGANISCLSKRLLKDIPFHLQPRLRPDPTASCHRTNSQALNVIGNFNLNLQIGKKTIIYKFHIICNLPEEAILGIDLSKHTS